MDVSDIKHQQEAYLKNNLIKTVNQTNSMDGTATA